MRIATVLASGLLIVVVAVFLTKSPDVPMANSPERLPVTFERTPAELIDPQGGVDVSDGPVVVPTPAPITPQAQAQLDEERRQLEANLPNLRRLRPDDFPELPATVKTALNDLGCRIPQNSPVAKDRNNVLRGRFRSAGEEVWAVVCSRRDQSSLLLVTDAGQVIDGAMDFGTDVTRIWQRDGVWVWGDPLHVVTPDYVWGANEAYGPITEEDRLPKRIDHDGIEETIEEKGAVTRYWYQGRWHSIVSGD